MLDKLAIWDEGVRPLRPSPGQAGEQVVEALEPAGGQHGLGRDDVDGLEVGEPGQQIEVGVPEAVVVAALVGNGDQHAAVRPSQSRRNQPVAQRVLVAGPQRVAPGFIPAEGRGQKSGLTQHAFGAGIAFRLGLERQRLQHEPFERRDVLTLPPHGVVQRDHLADQRRP